VIYDDSREWQLYLGYCIQEKATGEIRCGLNS
jgi:hypothetical protein